MPISHLILQAVNLTVTVNQHSGDNILCPEAVHGRGSCSRNEHRQDFMKALYQLRNLKPGIDKQEFMK